MTILIHQTFIFTGTELAAMRVLLVCLNELKTQYESYQLS